MSITNSEVRLEIPEDESTNNNERSRSILSILSTNNQQILNNVLAQIDVNQRISTFLDQQQQPPTSPNNQGDHSPGAFNREVPPAEHSPEDQNDEQYIIIWITILKILIQYIPLILILLIKCSVESFEVIVEILLLHGITWYLNLKLKKEVIKKTQRSKRKLIVLLIYILAVVHILVIYLIGETTQLGLLLVYSDTTNVALSQLLYQVIITDCILKLVSIFLKVCIAILPLKWIHLKQRQRSYAFIENVSQLYRCLAPVHIWLDYFFFAYSGWRTIFSGMFCSLYLGYKGFEINKKVKPVRKSFLALYRNVVSSIYFS